MSRAFVNASVSMWSCSRSTVSARLSSVMLATKPSTSSIPPAASNTPRPSSDTHFSAPSAVRIRYRRWKDRRAASAASIAATVSSRSSG